jgi:hypothetical protein
MGADLGTLLRCRLLDCLELVDRLCHLGQQRDQPFLFLSP